MQRDPGVQLISALDKLIRANKQLVMVAGAVAKKGSDDMGSQITQAREGLQKATQTLGEDKKAALKTTNANYVRSLVNRTASLSPQSSYLCTLCKSVAIEREAPALFKSVGTASTTLRDSLFLMVDTLMEMPAEWQDALAEATYYGVAKDVEKSLTALLSAKAASMGENVITRGILAQITAASCASVSACVRVVHAFRSHAKKTSDVSHAIKTSATAVSQLLTTTGNVVNKSDLGISHGLVQTSLTDGMASVKLALEQLVDRVSRSLGFKGDERHAVLLEERVEALRVAVVELLARVRVLGEVSISEVKNVPVVPGKVELEAAGKTVAKAMPATPAERPEGDEKPLKDLESCNIWDEPEGDDVNVLYTDEGKLKAASFNKVVMQMTSPDARGMKLLKAFVTTYRSIVTPDVFFDKLLERFEVPENQARNRTAIQARVCNVVSHWLKHQFEDLHEELIERVREFAYRIAEEQLLPEGVARNILAIVERQLERRSSRAEDPGVGAALNALALEPQIPLSPARILFVFNEEEIAKQLTMIDFQYYSVIQPVELLGLAWSKPELKWRARNVTSLIERSNAITLWVCSLIVWQATLKERSKVLTKIIAIAQHLAQLNNYNSLVAFVSALNNAAVHRLKHTFASLSPESTVALEELKKLTSVDQSYASYRNAIRSADGPAVPFLGVHLTDLTFIHEGNPKFINGLINVAKQEFVHNSIETIKKHQTTGYQFKYTEQLGAFLQELPHNNEDDLYKLSLYREKRGAPLEEIL